MGNFLIGQSGGATAVINASLVGAALAAMDEPAIDAVVGMRNGIEGLFYARISSIFVGNPPKPGRTYGARRRRRSVPVATSSPATTSTGLLLSCGATTFAISSTFGGNDSADTAHRLHERAEAAGHDLRVIAIPKTIRQCLSHTDHCPGYGSIARYLALATRDAGRDTESSPQLYPVKIIEVMGRNAGWVATGPSPCAG